MVQTPVDEHDDVKEFTVARMTAEYIGDTTDASGLFDAASRQRLREDVADACCIVEQKHIAAGITLVDQADELVSASAESWPSADIGPLCPNH